MDSQTTDITPFTDIYEYHVTIKALETQEQLITYDVTTKHFAILLYVRGLACM